MDTDYLLNLEQQFYQEGYEQGSGEKARENYIEGKQFGLQVGFQRFVILGQIQGILEVLKSSLVDGSNILKNVESIDRLLAEIEMSNDDAAVAEYESRIVKVRNKLRNVLLSLHRQSGSASGDSLTLEDVEEACTKVAGQLKAYVDEGNEEEDVNGQDHAMEW
ncbi:hypothetical protein HG536_0B01150 [Torulaspora globosa]|uniref:Essential protein Yae1 N-terminal domain-containing protein n=1 Tax=Torulaspora globosa TaxID=48254 RepID=A0A7G3ZCL8_9SACH|nr:uncharacterized protein HG536_0B01150 [Torulaspora globosa]QLL31254.1 hypothetical protein HG536_0B01150 [Torulaspora globosa]